MSDTHFTWMESYKAIADALLLRKNRRDGLQKLYVELTGVDDRVMIDPFTFFTTFNRGIIDFDRKNLIKTVTEELDIDAPLPQDFTGIPTANHALWQYFDNTEEAAEDCWQLFEAALEFADADAPDEELVKRFCEAFDKVHSQENITKARLTRTLYWMRPEFYLPFGEKTRDYVHSRYGLSTPIRMRAAQYLRTLQEMNVVCDRPFYEVAARAYRAADDSWWPYAIDYDPDMSIRQWMELLADEELTSDEVIKALRKIVELGGDATTDELAEERGRDRDYYATLLRGYARSAAQRMGRDNYRGSWWPFMFFGKNAGEDRRGDYIWRLRPEIIDALGALSR